MTRAEQKSCKRCETVAVAVAVAVAAGVYVRCEKSWPSFRDRQELEQAKGQLFRNDGPSRDALEAVVRKVFDLGALSWNEACKKNTGDLAKCWRIFQAGCEHERTVSDEKRA